MNTVMKPIKKKFEHNAIKEGVKRDIYVETWIEWDLFRNYFNSFVTRSTRSWRFEKFSMETLQINTAEGKNF